MNNRVPAIYRIEENFYELLMDRSPKPSESEVHAIIKTIHQSMQMAVSARAAHDWSKIDSVMELIDVSLGGAGVESIRGGWTTGGVHAAFVDMEDDDEVTVFYVEEENRFLLTSISDWKKKNA